MLEMLRGVDSSQDDHLDRVNFGDLYHDFSVSINDSVCSYTIELRVRSISHRDRAKFAPEQRSSLLNPREDCSILDLDNTVWC